MYIMMFIRLIAEICSSVSEDVAEGGAERGAAAAAGSGRGDGECAGVVIEGDGRFGVEGFGVSEASFAIARHRLFGVPVFAAVVVYAVLAVGDVDGGGVAGGDVRVADDGFAALDDDDGVALGCRCCANLDFRVVVFSGMSVGVWC